MPTVRAISIWGETLLTRPSGLLSGLPAESSACVLFCVVCLLNKCGGIYANPCDALQKNPTHLTTWAYA